MQVPQKVKDCENKTILIKYDGFEGKHLYLFSNKNKKYNSIKEISEEDKNKLILLKDISVSSIVLYADVDKINKYIDVYAIHTPSTHYSGSNSYKTCILDTVMCRLHFDGKHELFGIDDEYNIVHYSNRSNKFIKYPSDFEACYRFWTFYSRTCNTVINNHHGTFIYDPWCSTFDTVYCIINEDNVETKGNNSLFVDLYKKLVMPNCEDLLEEYKLRKHKGDFDINNIGNIATFINYKPYVRKDSKEKYLGSELENTEILNKALKHMNSVDCWARVDNYIVFYNESSHAVALKNIVNNKSFFYVISNHNNKTSIKSKISEYYFFSYCICVQTSVFTNTDERDIINLTELSNINKAIDKDGNRITINELFKDTLIEIMLNNNDSFNIKSVYTKICNKDNSNHYNNLENDTMIRFKSIPSIMINLTFSSINHILQQAITLKLDNIVRRLIAGKYDIATEKNIKDIIRNVENNIRFDTSNYIIKANCKSITKAFGMTMNQLIIYNEQAGDTNINMSNIIVLMRSFNISTLDLDLFKKLLINGKTNSSTIYSQLVKNGKSPKEIIDFVTSIPDYSGHHVADYMRLVNDYNVIINDINNNISVLKTLNNDNINEILEYAEKINFKNKYPSIPPANKVKEYHDRLSNIMNRLYNIRRFIQNKDDVIKFAETAKNNLKYNYTGEKYSMIVPISPFELINEGQILDHCVGSYVHSVAEGRETIVFLRRNEDLSTPFFTVDVDREHNIRQIKTKCNNDIDVRKTTIDDKEVTWSPKEIVAFLKEWASKCGVNKNTISEHYDARCAL